MSVFGNVDRGGDRVDARRVRQVARPSGGEKGDPIPIIWNHMWDNPEAHIGEVDPGDVVETDDGLRRQAAASTSTTRSPPRCSACCRERRVKEFSFGYQRA